MNILVTGGAGFIGANFVRMLLDETDDRVINLDLLTYAGNLANLTEYADNANYRFVKGDIMDRDLVRRILDQEKIEAVAHFAAESHVDRSVSGPEIFIRTNVLGTEILLEESRAAGVDRFLMVSTDEVYGSLGKNGLFTEKTPLAPNSPYAASKASADLLCRAFHKTFGFPVITTRCSNNYGPYQFPEKLIPLMIANAMEEKPLPVYGDGTNVRDWGWAPSVDFAEGLSRTVDWYLANRPWWETIRSGEYKNYYEKMYGQNGSHTSNPGDAR